MTDSYAAMYRRSIDDPEGFWTEQAALIDWSQPISAACSVQKDRKSTRLNSSH